MPSPNYILQQMRTQYLRAGRPDFDGAGLARLARALDEALCAGGPLPPEWLSRRRPRRAVITIADRQGRL